MKNVVLWFMGIGAICFTLGMFSSVIVPRYAGEIEAAAATNRATTCWLGIFVCVGTMAILSHLPNGPKPQP